TTDYTNGMSTSEINAVKNEFYQLTKYLMNTYHDTNKTFILQNWESDNYILPNAPVGYGDPGQTKIQGLIDWLNARQDGISQARNELSSLHGVHIYGSAEVNRINDARLNPSDPTKGNVVNRVLPYTHMDLYSYSVYEPTLPVDSNTLIANLDYLKSKAPDSAAFGADNIYIGEFGVPENNYPANSQLTNTKNVIETALSWGAKYAVYWQLYCNENSSTYSGRPTNTNVRGFWLIRPDSTVSPSYDYLKGIFKSKTVMTDDLNDWSKTYSHSANWRIDSSSAGTYFEYDAARVTRTTNTTENIVYNKSNLSDFTARVFYYTSITGRVNFYTSQNGSNWTPLPTTTDTPVTINNGWYKTNFRPSGSIPAGTNFLKVEFTNDSNIWSPQLSQISMSYAPTQFVDDLNDWSKVVSHTSSLAFDSSYSSNYFEGDASRVVRMTDTSESIVYNKTNASDFSAKVYYLNSVIGRVKVYTSPNGTTWTELSAINDTPIATNSGWYRTIFKPNVPIPSGTNYLKFELLNDANIYSPQLSQVMISY
ncbi:MAG: hypothetical protein H7X94_12415, partial [Vallitaleaceae bacterium]|nr:hypothetical protein [Vallitaleaceae bacterium]